MNQIELNLPSKNKIKIMIRKLLLTCSCIVLLTVSFSGKVYAAQEGELTVVSEELIKLNNLYKEGVITEEEFIKAKSILLNPEFETSGKKKRKKKKKKKKEKEEKLTASERRDLKIAEENKIKEEREEMLAEKRAFKQASAEEKERILEERRQACLDEPKTKGCGWMRTKKVLIFWK